MKQTVEKASVKALSQTRQEVIMTECLKALQQKSSTEPVTIEDVAAAIDVLHETGVSPENILRFLGKIGWEA